MDDFDPYYIWLGIPPEEQPADHYRLLGLRRFEQNRDVIVNAAEGKMAYLRTMQVGKRSKQSQALLNEVAAAQACLLNDKHRTAYDAKLRAVDAAGKSATSPQPLVPLAPLPISSVPLPIPLPRAVSPTLVLPVPVAPVDHAPTTVADLRLAPFPDLNRGPFHAADFHSGLKPVGQLPSSSKALQKLQAKLESLPRLAIIALGVGPIAVALLVLIAVMIATNGRFAPTQVPSMAESASAALAAGLSQEASKIVPPRPGLVPTAAHTPGSPVAGSTVERIRADIVPPLGPGSVQLKIDVGGAQIERVAFSQNGRFLAVESQDGGKRRLQLFDVQSGQKLLGVEGIAGAGRWAVADDSVLVAVEPSGLATIEIFSGRPRTRRPINGSIRDVALSQNWQSAFVLTDSELLQLNTHALDPVASLIPPGTSHSFTKLTARNTLLMATGDSGFDVFRIPERRKITGIQYGSNTPWRAYLPDEGSFVRLFEVNGRPRFERHALDNQNRLAADVLIDSPPVELAVAGQQGGSFIAWMTPTRELTLVDVQSLKPVCHVLPSEASFSQIALSPNGQWLAARDGMGPLLVVPIMKLVVEKRPFRWPSRQQLQQTPASFVVATTSIAGGAVNIVGMADNGSRPPLLSNTDNRPPTQNGPMPMQQASPERLAEAMAALQAAGLQLHTQEPTQLQHVNLNNKSDDSLADHIAVLPRVQAVFVSGDALVTPNFFRNLRASNSLYQIHLPPNAGDSWLREIAQIRSLHSLHLQRSDGQPGGFTAAGILQLSALPKLQELSLNGDVGADLVSALPALKTLKVVSYFGSSTSAPELAKTLVSLPQMQSLNLHLPVDDSLIATLVQASPNLNSLTLERSQLTDAGLRELSALTNLSFLVVSGEFSAKGFREIGQLQNLNYLRLNRVSLSGEHLDTLAKLGNLQNLQVNDSLLESDAIDSFCKLTQVQYVNLQGTYISDEDLAKLRKSLKHVEAYSIPARPRKPPRIVSQAERDQAREAVARLQTAGVQIHVNGQGEPESIVLPQDLSEANEKYLSRLTTLRSVHFASDHRDSKRSLQALMNSKELNSLSLPYAIDDECLGLVAQMSSVTQLSVLGLTGDQNAKRPFTAAGLSKLSALPLRSLTINFPLEGKDVKALQQCKQVSEFHWSTPDAPPNLLVGQIVAFPELRILGINCKGGDGIVKTIVDANTKLTFLDLQSSNLELTDRSLKHLAALADLNHLIVNGDFTVVGFKSVSELKKLNYLGVNRSKISRASVQELAALPNLQTLMFHSAKFEPKAIEALGKLDNVTNLMIFESGISEADAATLKKLKPQATIHQQGRRL
jgi:Leucine-rich repeat (LRR) protein